MTSNTCSFAQRELDILIKSSTDPENRPIIEEFIPEILALVDKFGNSGQSGGSAPYVATAISSTVKKLCLQEPICPVTGIEEEWVDITEMNGGETMYQNIRCYGLFKKDGKARYVDAIVWKDQNALTFTGSAYVKNSNKKYRSSQCIKSFPFTPKTFYIDVIMEETAPGWFIAYIKDFSQLEAAAKCYNLSFETESPVLEPPKASVSEDTPQTSQRD